MLKSVICAVMSFFMLLSGAANQLATKLFASYSFEVDTSVQGDVLPNPVSNVNVWDMKTSGFDTATVNKENNIFDFVEYVQLMQCTGGNEDRDLFINPKDNTVLDDYDFSSLIANCRGIISLGAKPHLKLGSVPLKFTSGAVLSSSFGTNLYPPDDYNAYYNYIADVADALVDEFGRDEVRTWRFGVMTEYENGDWFMSKSGSPDDSAREYCKLYDFTVAALQEVIGEDIFVGAHAMSVTEGLWDETDFIRHCANGINYKTGKKGSRLCFLSASFYDLRPGEYTEGKALTQTIGDLRSCAEQVGLNNLIYGVDEGRLLFGVTSGAGDNQLITRICGYTYQAAYDARLIKTLFDNGFNYFSSWGYLSGGMFSGNPTVSYHVAKNAAGFAGSRAVKTKSVFNGLLFSSEVQAFAAYDEAADTVHIMAYNFKNDIKYKRSANVIIDVNAPQFKGKTVKITRYVIDDSCNYFDEWVEDRKALGIDDSCFLWSPDDPQIDSPLTLADEKAREIYFDELYDKYTVCSRLVPAEETAVVKNGSVALEQQLNPNAVVFYEITPC